MPILFATENSHYSDIMKSAEGMEFFVRRERRPTDGKWIYIAKTVDGEILCAPVAGMDVIDYVCERIIRSGIHSLEYDNNRESSDYSDYRDDVASVYSDHQKGVASAAINELNNARQILSTVRCYSGVWAHEYQRLNWSLQYATEILSELVR